MLYPVNDVLNRSLLSMIRLQVEDVPSVEAVRRPILAFLILWDPRSVLRLPPWALMSWVFCLPPFPLLVEVAEIPDMLAVEAVSALALFLSSLCLTCLSFYQGAAHLSVLDARGGKSYAGERQGKKEQLHGRAESWRETIGQESFNPFIWPASADAAASWSWLHQAMGTGNSQLSEFWQLGNHSYLKSCIMSRILLRNSCMMWRWW